MNSNHFTIRTIIFLTLLKHSIPLWLFNFNRTQKPQINDQILNEDALTQTDSVAHKAQFDKAEDVEEEKSPDFTPPNVFKNRVVDTIRKIETNPSCTLECHKKIKSARLLLSKSTGASDDKLIDSPEKSRKVPSVFTFAWEILKATKSWTPAKEIAEILKKHQSTLKIVEKEVEAMDRDKVQAHTKEVLVHTEEIFVPIAEAGKEIQELEPVLTAPLANPEAPNHRFKRGANGTRTGTLLRSFTKGLMKKKFKDVPSFLLATFKLNWTCYRAFILRAFKRKRFDETKLKKEVSGFCRWLVRWGQDGSTKLRTFSGFIATIFMSAISIVGLPLWIVLDIIILWLYCLATVP